MITANTDNDFMRGFMPSLPVASFETLLDKAVKTFKFTSLGQVASDKQESSTDDNPLSVKQILLNHNPLTSYQQHTLHYVMKGFGYLPTPLLESLINPSSG